MRVFALLALMLSAVGFAATASAQTAEQVQGAGDKPLVIMVSYGG
jgi:hypothetical protein